MRFCKSEKSFISKMFLNKLIEDDITIRFNLIFADLKIEIITIKEENEKIYF